MTKTHLTKISVEIMVKVLDTFTLPIVVEDFKICSVSLSNYQEILQVSGSFKTVCKLRKVLENY